MTVVCAQVKAKHKLSIRIHIDIDIWKDVSCLICSKSKNWWKIPDKLKVYKSYFETALGKGKLGVLVNWQKPPSVKGAKLNIFYFFSRLTEYRANPTMPCKSHISSDTTTVVQLSPGAGPSFAKGTKLAKAVSVAMVSVFKEHQEILTWF